MKKCIKDLNNNMLVHFFIYICASLIKLYKINIYIIKTHSIGITRIFNIIFFVLDQGRGNGACSIRNMLQY